MLTPPFGCGNSTNEWRDCRRPQHRLDIEDCKDPEGFGNSLGEFHRLYGNTGANSLVGGRGNDVISGNSGSDLIYGGIGADRTYGGSGADRFVFKALGESAGSSFDSIFDFAPSSGDRIDLSAIDASTKFSGNQAFSFVGTAAFKGVAGELRYHKQASDTFIYADVDGDKKADLTIHLDDVVTLTKDYFLL